MDKKIQWGIIGCGDVTEVKSGPAFNKVPGSALIAVMRRDEAKAKDYAQRHGVPKYYSSAQQLIDDPDINAIYIATPPGSHEEYALAAIEAGKPVYVEKPMALNYMAALNIQQKVKEKNVKLVVAHYRNAQPFFLAIQQMILDGSLGNILTVSLVFDRMPLTRAELQQETKAWRVNPSISGGGLFHDMAPHQVGLMLNFFGKVKDARGTSFNTNDLYSADDR
jgi:predicted dehydrogenase